MLRRSCEFGEYPVDTQRSGAQDRRRGDDHDEPMPRMRRADASDGSVPDVQEPASPRAEANRPCRAAGRAGDWRNGVSVVRVGRARQRARRSRNDPARSDARTRPDVSRRDRVARNGCAVNRDRQTSRAAVRLRVAADAWSKYKPNLNSWSDRDHEGERLWAALSDAADAYARTRPDTGAEWPREIARARCVECKDSAAK